MIYTHVLNQGGRGVRSPLDRLAPVSGRRWGASYAAALAGTVALSRSAYRGRSISPISL